MEYVKYTTEGMVGIVTIDRPKALNALNSQVLTELEQTFDAIDQETIRCVIVTGGVLVFGLHTTLYALIAVYVTTAVADRVVDGLHYSKAIYIVSDKGREIASEILRQIDRGVTGLEGEGMYTGDGKLVLLCTASAKESVRIKEIAHDIDPRAFMIISDAREVVGEGFSVEKT